MPAPLPANPRAWMSPAEPREFSEAPIDVCTEPLFDRETVEKLVAAGFERGASYLRDAAAKACERAQDESHRLGTFEPNGNSCASVIRKLALTPDEAFERALRSCL